MPIEPDVYAWQFYTGEHEWRKSYATDMVLYKKSDILKRIKKLNFSSIIELEHGLNAGFFDLHSVGLCWDRSRAVNFLK